MADWTFQPGDVVDRKGIDTSELLQVAPAGVIVRDVHGVEYRRTAGEHWRMVGLIVEATHQYIADCSPVRVVRGPHDIDVD